MIKKDASIPEVVRKYAEEWADQYILVKDDSTPNRSSNLKDFVRKYLQNSLAQIMDGFMGINRRSFGECRVVPTNYNSEKTIAMRILEETAPILTERLREYIVPKNFNLTEKQIKELREDFERTLLYKLRDKFRSLAEEKAQYFAELSLTQVLSDSEFALLVEGKLEGRDRK